MVVVVVVFVVAGMSWMKKCRVGSCSSYVAASDGHDDGDGGGGGDAQGRFRCPPRCRRRLTWTGRR